MRARAPLLCLWNTALAVLLSNPCILVTSKILLRKDALVKITRIATVTSSLSQFVPNQYKKGQFQLPASSEELVLVKFLLLLTCNP